MINWNSFACFTILLLCLWIRQPPSTEQRLLWDYAALGGMGGGGVCRVLLGDSVKLVCTNECLCNLSRKKSREVAASFLGQFLSRRCFMLCITMEVEPRIAKQYKCHHRCSCKNYHGKGMEGEKKVSLVVQKITSSWKKCVLGHPIARATSYCLLPDTLWLRASKNAFKVGSVKFTNSLSLPSMLKEVSTGSKSSQGT